ncbi:MAG: hypothetical protein M1522_04295 [Actinobacteria bacterium]|jgi:hypothetical protein|nr:hypothetical protein [Actinomycetota bacterium]MDA8184753.1 hypothetical protein [Actinomycetota bacterium]
MKRIEGLESRVPTNPARRARLGRYRAKDAKQVRDILGVQRVALTTADSPTRRSA